MIFFHPTLNSGIQRVVRNIATQARGSNQEMECLPIFLLNNSIFEITNLTPTKIELILSKVHRYFSRLFVKLENRYETYLNDRDGRKSSVFGHLLFILTGTNAFLVRVARYAAKHAYRFVAMRTRSRSLDIEPDDVIILLDASWQQDFRDFIDNVKSEGTQIVAVIYDLIPLTHPMYFQESLIKQFERWFEWITKTADGFMGISKHVCIQVETEISKRLPANDFQKKWFDFFYLGSELDLAGKTKVRRHVSEIFLKTRTLYLMVSTLEPRKNHDYLIDAFDVLWERGEDVCLCFVGRLGWKYESLLRRIESHPELNRRFFVLNDLNDAELEFAYQHSKALVFSSVAEGFGLPLVEGMQRGLPVMASDISVFREVGGDYCAYFLLEDPRSLTSLVMEFESTGSFPSIKPLSDFSWLNWKRAAEIFLEKVKLNSVQASHFEIDG